MTKVDATPENFEVFKDEIKKYLDKEGHSAIIFLGFGPMGLRSMYGCDGNHDSIPNEMFDRTAHYVKVIMGTIHD